MVKRIVLKVDVSCQKCRKKLIKAVAGLQGIDKIEIDDAKSTLTVTGDADPIEVIVRTRKAGKFAEVVSIGPPPAPPKQAEAPKKPEEKKPAVPEKKTEPPPPPPKAVVVHVPSACPGCQQLGAHEPPPFCAVM